MKTMKELVIAAKNAGFREVKVEHKNVYLENYKIDATNAVNTIFDIAEKLAYTTLGDKFSELYFAICEL